MPIKPPLSPANQQFCELVAEFCSRHTISIRRLSMLCNGYANRFSRSQAHRFLTLAADDATVERMMPAIREGLTNFLTKNGLSTDEVESELSSIFEPKEIATMIADRCTLTPDAIRFFNLTRDPFDVDRLPLENELYKNEDLDRLTDRIIDAAQFQRFIAVIGQVGSGKTLLKIRVAHEIAERQLKIELIYPEFFDMSDVSVHGIANKLLVELGQTVPRNKEERVTKIRRTLAELHSDGTNVAIVLDEAHRLQDRVLSSLKNFWEMTNGRNSRLLAVVLFGQPAFVQQRLRDVTFKEVRQRVQIFDMPSFTAPTADRSIDVDTAISYIRHRIAVAGGDIDNLFERKAIERICLNASTPLALGNLTNGALMSAFLHEEPRVEASMAFFKHLAGHGVLAMRTAN